jgi:hypothetical protein
VSYWVQCDAAERSRREIAEIIRRPGMGRFMQTQGEEQHRKLNHGSADVELMQQIHPLDFPPDKGVELYHKILMPLGPVREFRGVARMEIRNPR